MPPRWNYLIEDLPHYGFPRNLFWAQAAAMDRVYISTLWLHRHRILFRPPSSKIARAVEAFALLGPLARTPAAQRQSRGLGCRLMEIDLSAGLRRSAWAGSRSLMRAISSARVRTLTRQRRVSR